VGLANPPLHRTARSPALLGLASPPTFALPHLGASVPPLSGHVLGSPAPMNWLSRHKRPILSLAAVMWLAWVPACDVVYQVDEGNAPADSQSARLATAYFDLLSLPVVRPYQALSVRRQDSPPSAVFGLLTPLVFLGGFVVAALLYSALLWFVVTSIFVLLRGRPRPRAA
jgi:hypothetical protein